MKKAVEISDYNFSQVDFDNPSFLFVVEDILKEYLGCLLFYNKVIKKLGLKGDEKILDYGCGGGTGSKCLLKHLDENGHLTCIDTSNYWIKKAKRRLNKYRNIKCMLGDVEDLNIPDNSYDVITVMHVIHDIEPEYRQNTVNILCHKLKSNGSLFIWEPIKTSHGMAVNEIQSIFKNANLREVENSIDKKQYMGKFIKNA
jgi:ubiquinone/menaquinone biosynthesis C-methylase UbiE